MKKINHLDLFSGIGGFHLGFERAGFKINSFFSEIDKHAIAVYKHKFPKSTYVGSVTNVRGGDLPRIDLITFGSPCQDFSLAGKRAGMGGDRSSLILEAIRLIGECRPRVFIWENVKGTFSSNSGEDFAAIIQEFANIGGYRLEWQLLNTSWFLPQNRERIYLVGYSTTPKRGWRGVFPIRESNQQTNLIGLNVVSNCEKDVQSRRVYGEDGICRTLTSGDYKSPVRVEVKQIGIRLDSGGKQPYQQDRVYDADGIVPALNRGKSDLIVKHEIGDYRSDEGWRPRKDGNCPTLAARAREDGSGQPLLKFKSDLIVAMRGRYNEDGTTSQKLEINPSGNSNTLTAVQKDNMIIQPNYSDKSLNETIEQNVLMEGEPKALDLYNRAAKDESPTLKEPHHNSLRLFDGYRIRRLTPIECERLQGFPDDHTSLGNYDGETKPMSNTQRYKQCGNAVTVDVVEAVAKKCIPLF
jgi:DNA (cytosine-5)-methyltransferase 1